MPWAGGTRGKYDKETGQLRKDVAEHAAIILNRFEELRIRGGTDKVFYELPLLGDLIGGDFWLYSGSAGGDLLARMAGGDKYSKSGNIEPSELAAAAWPLDCGIVGYHEARADDDEYDINLAHVAMQWIKTVTPKEMRGKVRMTSPKMVRVVSGTFGDNGRWRVNEYVLGLINNKWINLGEGMESERQTGGYLKFRRLSDDPEWCNKLMSHVTAEAIESRYRWHAAFGVAGDPEGPRLLLPTNPNYALKLFRDREVADGMDRRTALRHWVEKHLRESNEHTTAYVRDHLRGHKDFGWSGFDCELMVSAYDLEKNEAFRLEAEHWRAVRKHNRVKVHLKRSKNGKK
jgi:hypothetical protein